MTDNDILKRAINKVYEELSSMSDVEFRKELKKYQFREFLCLHNPKSYNGVCNDEGGNYCPDECWRSSL